MVRDLMHRAAGDELVICVVFVFFLPFFFATFGPKLSNRNRNKSALLETKFMALPMQPLCFGLISLAAEFLVCSEIWKHLRD